jgi:GT2 family glycosyltransferase
MKHITIMVSLYNSGEWLENRLTNIFESTNISDCEVICLNANSPDPRDHEIPQRFPVKYIKLDRRNTVYEAWNHIIENSDSLYITNANSDDLINPLAYNMMARTMDNDESIGMVYISWFCFNGTNLRWNDIITPTWERPGHYNGNTDTATVGHFPMWRRSLHYKLGLFDTSYKALADAEWWARVHYKSNFAIKWIDQPLGGYHYRNGQNLWHQSITAEEWDKYHRQVCQYKSLK